VWLEFTRNIISSSQFQNETKVGAKTIVCTDDKTLIKPVEIANEFNTND